MKHSRKQFLRLLGAGALTATVSPAVTAHPEASTFAGKEPHPLNVGLASYTLRSLTLEEVIAVAKRLNLHSVALKSMHLPLDATPKQIKAVADKVRAAGLDLYGAGVIYMKSEDEVNNAFDYARAAGMRVIIGVPNYELLPLVEKRVKETDIKLAIHNHGPGDEVYPSPDNVYEKVRNLDSRVGLCIDIGHTFRIGQDPAAKARQYADRLHDVHLKDVDRADAEGKSLEIGRGIMDIPAFIRTLQEIKYAGVVGLEYEKDGDDPVPGLAESVGFVHGAVAGMSA